jgi:hypothetical protein
MGAIMAPKRLGKTSNRDTKRKKAKPVAARGETPKRGTKRRKAKPVEMPHPTRPLVPDPSTWQPQDNNGGRIAREAADQRRRFVAATQSGLIEPPLPPRPEPTAALLPGAGGVTADTVHVVTGPTIPIIPTLYPREPDAAVIVQNHLTINVRSDEFRELNGKLGELLSLLRRSNEISGEVRDQLAAEIAAGKALLCAPKLDPSLIELLLKRPLTLKAAGAAIGAIAVAALGLLGKLTGLW